MADNPRIREAMNTLLTLFQEENLEKKPPAQYSDAMRYQAINGVLPIACSCFSMIQMMAAASSNGRKGVGRYVKKLHNGTSLIPICRS